MRIKTILLGAVMVAALLAGVWFFISPSLNRQADLALQGDLLDSVTAFIADVEAEIPAGDSTDPCEIEAGIDWHEEEQSIYFEHENDELVATPPEPLDPADFPSGITPIGILTIDSIDLRLPVMDGVGEPELRIAPGRIPQTAHVGDTGNAVIIGHRNFAFGSMFNRLDEVEIGNIVKFQAMNGEKTTFEVFEVLVITPDDQIAFIQPQDESIITLYTCTPIRVASHRLLVRARIIEGGI